jgi:hypothetical protein
VQPTDIILKQLEELARLLKSYNTADKLHYEILKRKCMDVYERILLLDDLSEFETQTEDNEPVIESNPIKATETDLETVELAAAPLLGGIINDVVESETEETIESIQEVKSVVEQEENPIQEFKPYPVPEIQVSVIEDTKEVEQELPKPIEQDLFANVITPPPVAPPATEVSLHEKLSAHMDQKTMLADKFGRKVENLKSAISLNQKIAFVNILFKENTVEYAKSIERLNQASNIDEALRYFTELKHNYDWENNHELVRDLQQLIEKRFL